MRFQVNGLRTWSVPECLHSYHLYLCLIPCYSCFHPILVLSTVFWSNFLWDFSEEICEFGAAFDYSWESVRRNTESLGFCSWLFPGLVFIVPRKSIFPLSILFHFLSLSMVLDHLLFFPLSIYTSQAGALEDIIHIPVKCQEKYLTWD